MSDNGRLRTGWSQHWRHGVAVLAVVVLAGGLGFTPNASALSGHHPDSNESHADPGAVTLAASGQCRAYVTNPGNDTVSVINTTTNTVTATIEAGANPYGVAVTPNGANAYVANFVSNTVAVVDTRAIPISISDGLAVGDGPAGVAASSDGTRVYVTNQLDNTVSAINTADLGIVEIPVEDQPLGVAVSPDSGTAYVTNLGSDTVSVINTATDRVTATINVGDRPFGVAVNPAGTRVYVTNLSDDTVSVIDATTNTVAATIDVGGVPYGVAVAPNGLTAYVTNFEDGTVSVIDTTRNRTTATINVGGLPFGVAIAPGGTFAYVTNQFDNTVSVIDTVANAADTTINVGAGTRPQGVAFGPCDTAPVAPSQPENVTGIPGNARVTVSWSAPGSDGGTAVTRYTVTASPGGRTCGTTGAVSCVVSGLTNGARYSFTVVATNAAGTSAPSAASATLTPAGPPSAPRSPQATPGNTRAKVSWTRPASNGGAVINRYTVTASPGGKTCTTAGARSCVVTGLRNGTRYTFRVVATNTAGNSPRSAASSQVTPRTVPGAPRNVQATAGTRQATVTWRAPAATGGAAITGYRIQRSTNGRNWTQVATRPASVRSITLRNLTSRTTYQFRVLAVNAVGPGSPSRVVSARVR